MVSSTRELYDAAMQILSELSALMVSTVGIVMVISLLPAILRQIALWIARVRLEYRNMTQSLTLALDDLENHVGVMSGA
ncbi:unnamed protein product [Allacma fusca]|uniref:Uncharacterized protein n=1 Tax=Allacma fusca TaxID=39272 RepID=A0A8J2PJY4_9HEXA|nr:unnamed protein product [Allacma fusca]